MKTNLVQKGSQKGDGDGVSKPLLTTWGVR